MKGAVEKKQHHGRRKIGKQGRRFATVPVFFKRELGRSVVSDTTGTTKGVRFCCCCALSCCAFLVIKCVCNRISLAEEARSKQQVRGNGR